jgi:hypothetical protein
MNCGGNTITASVLLKDEESSQSRGKIVRTIPPNKSRYAAISLTRRRAERLARGGCG